MSKFAFIDNNSGYLMFVESAETPELALEAGLLSIGEHPVAAKRDGERSYYDCHDVSTLAGVDAFDGQDDESIKLVAACKFIGEYIGVERA